MESGFDGRWHFCETMDTSARQTTEIEFHTVDVKNTCISNLLYAQPIAIKLLD
jgi:hypothetical protein